MTDLEIQKHIEENYRYIDGTPMIDEQTFYEGAKWYRDYVVNKLPAPIVGKAKRRFCHTCNEAMSDNQCFNTDCLDNDLPW